VALLLTRCFICDGRWPRAVVFPHCLELVKLSWSAGSDAGPPIMRDGLAELSPMKGNKDDEGTGASAL